jgi:hypothetical protein
LIIGGINFGPLKVALVDFNHINKEYAKFSDKKIVGLIGCDFLFSRKAILDFDQQKLKLLVDIDSYDSTTMSFDPLQPIEGLIESV